MRCNFNTSVDFWAVTLIVCQCENIYLYLCIIKYVVNSSNQASSELCKLMRTCYSVKALEK